MKMVSSLIYSIANNKNWLESKSRMKEISQTNNAFVVKVLLQRGCCMDLIKVKNKKIQPLNREKMQGSRDRISLKQRH